MTSTEEWKNLTIKNNYIFTKMAEDPQICAGIIEDATSIKVGKLDYIQSERVIDVDKDNKSIRLDVYAKDENVIYNVEMQSINWGDLVHRSRMYSSIITVESLFKGVEYDQLTESYVIFFCDFDLFGLNLPVYTFRYVCEEATELKLEDGTCIIFLNAMATDFHGNETLQAIFKYMHGEVVENQLIQDMEQRMKLIKANPDWRRECMTMIMRERLLIKQGVKEGIEIGIEQGIEQGIAIGEEKKQLKMAGKMLATMTDDVIASFTELTVERVAQLRKEVGETQ